MRKTHSTRACQHGKLVATFTVRVPIEHNSALCISMAYHAMQAALGTVKGATIEPEIPVTEQP